METCDLLVGLEACLAEIPNLKKIPDGFHNPHFKGWKTKLEELLRDGGTTCSKPLEAVRNMKAVLAGTDFIKTQTYITQLDALERGLQQTIQTIKVFGRPEDNDILPHWGKPKCQGLAAGHLMVGDEDIATEDITIHEVLDCLVSLAEDSNDLHESMRDRLIEHLNAIIGDDLLQPFLSKKMDVLLGHWPEFQTK